MRAGACPCLFVLLSVCPVVVKNLLCVCFFVNLVWCGNLEGLFRFFIPATREEAHGRRRRHYS